MKTVVTILFVCIFFQSHAQDTLRLKDGSDWCYIKLGEYEYLYGAMDSIGNIKIPFQYSNLNNYNRLGVDCYFAQNLEHGVDIYSESGELLFDIPYKSSSVFGNPKDFSPDGRIYIELYSDGERNKNCALGVFYLAEKRVEVLSDFKYSYFMYDWKNKKADYIIGVYSDEKKVKISLKGKETEPFTNGN